MLQFDTLLVGPLQSERADSQSYSNFFDMVMTKAPIDLWNATIIGDIDACVCTI